MYQEYQAAPEVTRRRLLIETLEKVLSNSGRIIVADNQSEVVKILDLNDPGQSTQTAAAALEGGQEP